MLQDGVACYVIAHSLHDVRMLLLEPCLILIAVVCTCTCIVLVLESGLS